MNLLLKTYRLFSITINIVAGCLLLFSAYSHLIPPTAWKLPIYFALAFPVILFIVVLLTVIQLFIRPRKYALIPIVFLLICAPTIRTYFPIGGVYSHNDKTTFTVMSYNIMAFREAEKTKNGTSNTLLDLINQCGADVVCMQEYRTSTKTGERYPTQRQVNKALSAYPYHHVSYPKNSKIGIACYSKHPIKKIEAIPFYNTPTPHRACLYEIEIDGRKLHLINCHMQSNQLDTHDRELYAQITQNPTHATDLLPQVGDKLLRKLSKAAIVRADQAQILDNIIEKMPSSIVVCGDFNDTPQSYTYYKVRGDLHDAYVSAGFGPGITYHAAGFRFRIDHILHGEGLRALDCDIIREKYSDHYPIIATLQYY